MCGVERWLFRQILDNTTEKPDAILGIVPTDNANSVFLSPPVEANLSPLIAPDVFNAHRIDKAIRMTDVYRSVGELWEREKQTECVNSLIPYVGDSLKHLYCGVAPYHKLCKFLAHRRWEVEGCLLDHGANIGNNPDTGKCFRMTRLRTPR